MEPARTGRVHLRAGGGFAARWLVVAVCLCAGSAADAALLGVAWDSSDSPVYRIDEDFGVAELIGYSGFRGLNSLALSPAGVYYSVATNPSESVLVTIDPATGAGSYVASVGVLGVRGLACDSAGLIYGTVGNGRVLRIDADTGATHIVVQTSYTEMQGLGWSPDGLLYAWDSNAGLIRIDPVAGTAVDVDPTTSGQAGIQTLYFTHEGELAGGRDTIYRLHLTADTMSALYSVGSLDLRGVESLVPEPAAILLAAGAVVLATIRGRGAARASRHPIR